LGRAGFALLLLLALIAIWYANKKRSRKH
jgi:hypothetical protein